jgi:hypothetical protein
MVWPASTCSGSWPLHLFLMTLTGATAAKASHACWRVTQTAWRRGFQDNRHKPPPLVDQDLALTRVETPRGWGGPCPHASRRCPP